MRKKSRPVEHTLWVPLLLALVVGCSSPWKAPVESRSVSGKSFNAISGDSYRVRSGDTLYGIAWRAGSDYRDIARWNNIQKPYTIYVGQRLRLKPTPVTKTASPGDNAKSSKQASKGSSTATKNASAMPVSTTRKNSAQPQGYKKSLAWVWPTDGRVLQGFSSKDETRKGIKISGRKGQSIIAAEQGEVVYSGSGLVGYGELIIIKHNNEYLSAYGHNDKRLVKEGERVTRGTTIAQMGLSGGEPLLHFEIRRKGKPVNPIGILPKR
jgi:lipoprotein NlpD